MSAFIRLNKQDAFVVPHTAHKTFSLVSTLNSGSEGLEFYYGTRDRSTLFTQSESIENNEYPRLIYDSINHLYFSNYTSSIESGSFENYNQSTLFYTRSLSQLDTDNIFVFSLKRERVGEAIKPGTFNFYSGSTFAILDDTEGNLYSSASFTWISQQPEYFYYSESVDLKLVNVPTSIDVLTAPSPPSGYSYISASWLGDIADTPFRDGGGPIAAIDSQGVSITGITITTDTSVYTFQNTTKVGPVELLYISSSYPAYTVSANETIGNIFYPHGIAVVTNSDLATRVWTVEQYSSSFSWQNTHTIFQHEYRCRVKEGNLNYSQNPSIHSGSISTTVSGSTFFQHSGIPYDFATGSYFQPYVTTIGLYNDANELVAVGKLAQPVPKSRYTDMTFVVKLDI